METRIDNVVTPLGEKKLQCRTFNFTTDTLIPVVIVYVTTDYSFESFGGRIVKKGPCVLLLRRGFEVAAMPGMWSVVAGVDDIVDERFKPEDRTLYRAYDEAIEEVGLRSHHGFVNRIDYLGQREQPNPSMPEQLFRQRHFWVEVECPERVGLTYEHTGAVWVPISEIQAYLQTGVTSSKVLLSVIKDGVVPGLWKGMRFLCDAFQGRYSA